MISLKNSFSFVRLFSSESAGFKHNYHDFHLVDPSIWPVFTSLGALLLTNGSVIYFHSSDAFWMKLGLIQVIVGMVGWWRDVINESFQYHTPVVQRGLRLGFILFIVSEVMFFFGFFWGFFHSSLAPSIFIGGIWPPKGIEPFDPWTIPLANTLILLLSGASITWAHHAIIADEKEDTRAAFMVTLFLAGYFTLLQLYEYISAPFSISDSVYGATFFMMTGFHGFHVLIGTIFIAVCFMRFKLGHFTPNHHIGFEAAAWYWHFVDVVWLFLFGVVYWWGGILVNEEDFYSFVKEFMH